MEEAKGLRYPEEPSLTMEKQGVEFKGSGMMKRNY